MQQLNEQQKAKAQKLSKKVLDLADEIDETACKLVCQKEYFINQEDKDKILKAYELLREVGSNLLFKAK